MSCQLHFEGNIIPARMMLSRKDFEYDAVLYHTEVARRVRVDNGCAKLSTLTLETRVRLLNPVCG